MEDRPKTRPTARRRPAAAKASMPAASSPATNPRAAFNMCGHDGCGTSSCNVRYVGPVSHIRDHHALHAARGVAHVWTAAIVSGLAVVVTGFLAYNAAQAQTVRRTQPQTADMATVMQRLDRLEQALNNVAQRCAGPVENMDGNNAGMQDQEENTEGRPNRRLPSPTERREITPPIKKIVPPSAPNTNAQ